MKLAVVKLNWGFYLKVTVVVIVVVVVAVEGGGDGEVDTQLHEWFVKLELGHQALCDGNFYGNHKQHI